MLEKRPCSSCKQNEAKVKFTKLIKGKVEELHLCPDCAGKQSPYQKKLTPPQLDEILAGILGQAKSEGAAKISGADLTCATCGLPYGSYRETLLLGCSDCYESFEKQLTADLRKFHGSTVHRGRVPNDAPAQFLVQRSPQEIKKRLNDAVKAEDFELAAKLRDELRGIESNVATEPGPAA
ncbi:MAG: UvrB/UvrC motif-containing protein [Candidatus Sumerlaeaceae bacterium]